MEKKVVPYFLILPSFILLIFILLYQITYNVYLSFYNWSFINPTHKEFLGIQNYLKILTNDPLFWSTLKVTFIFVAVTISIEFCVGFSAALLLNSLQRGRRVLTACLILPYMVARIATGLTWKLLWSYDFGLMNYFLSLVGVDRVVWLGNPSTALFAVIISEIWRATPFITLVLLAGLSSLPHEPFEAAKVDGASSWQVFRHITLPLLIPSIGVALLFQTIFKIRVFDLIFILTEGGPLNATLPLGILIYRTYFRYFEGGYSAAIACLMLAIGILVSIFYLRLIFRKM